ncbi:MAG: prephenate dehydrogenase [Lachnospiraceae bacterium]|nr:prephenate dehydrogenase [Lachnospiraceae bacterium]
MNKRKVLVVGLGLMGGSYAMTLKRLGFEVWAIDKSKESIEYAIENKIIDKGDFRDNEELISGCDCIIMAVYPSGIVKWIEDNKDKFKKHIFITDVTGVKSAIVTKIQDILGPDYEFIASHPMAGRETNGVANANDKMFRDANFIVVYTDKNTSEGIRWCENLGRILGFNRISHLTPEEHDDIIAYVSQLTHCIAVSLMNCDGAQDMVSYTGDSFRDLTRIAKINENMWTELFFMNKDRLIKRMDSFIKEITDMRDLIVREDAENLKEKMRISTARRKKFDEK